MSRTGDQPKLKIGTPSRRSGSGSPAGDLEIISSEAPPPSQLNDAIVIGFSIAAAVAAVVFGVVLTLDGPLPLYGGALAVSLFCLGFAIRRYFVDRFPVIEAIEPRLQLSDPEAEQAPEAPGELAEVHAVGRRPLLRWALIGSGVTFAASLAAPVSTLGPTVGDQLRRTAWRRGTRLVTTVGDYLQPGDLPPGGVSTVWPEGFIGNEFSSTLLLRTDAEPEPPTNPDWVVGEWVLAYSKVCTHAGCPVALYREVDEALFCPCHQSTFDVLRGAEPIFGPAARALPQLPLGVDDDGYLIALGDFQSQVGPAYG